VLGYFEQVEDAEETGCAGQCRGDIRQADGLDGVDFAFVHAVTRACFYVGARPDADAAGDFAAANSIAEALGEDHGVSLLRSDGLPVSLGTNLSHSVPYVLSRISEPRYGTPVLRLIGAVASGFHIVVGGLDVGGLGGEQLADGQGEFSVHGVFVGFDRFVFALFRGFEEGVVASA
jgi:hypothetical protein